jgi:hypothetical protein
MEVNYQFHTPAALTLGDKPQVIIDQEGGRAPAPALPMWRWENCIAPAKNRPPIAQSSSPQLNHYIDWAIVNQSFFMEAYEHDFCSPDNTGNSRSRSPDEGEACPVLKN